MLALTAGVKVGRHLYPFKGKQARTPQYPARSCRLEICTLSSALRGKDAEGLLRLGVLSYLFSVTSCRQFLESVFLFLVPDR